MVVHFPGKLNDRNQMTNGDDRNGKGLKFLLKNGASSSTMSFWTRSVGNCIFVNKSVVKDDSYVRSSNEASFEKGEKTQKCSKKLILYTAKKILRKVRILVIVSQQANCGAI